MALTVTPASEEILAWEDDFHVEYLRNNQFSRYMGNTENSVIHMVEKLVNMRGLKVTVNLVGALTNDEVLGGNTLKGSGEKLPTYGHEIACTFRRNSVEFTKEENFKHAIDVMNAARPTLMNWRQDKTRDNVIEALGSIYGVRYGATTPGTGDSTEANRDLWNASNSDRILFGAAESNQSGDQSADMAKLDNTNDKLTLSAASHLKRMVQALSGGITSPRMRPFRVVNNTSEEWYVMFCNSRSWRDLKEDIRDNGTDTVQPASDFYTKGGKHPFLVGGDLVYDGIAFRQIPEIAIMTGAGAAGIDAAPNYLCGAQALGYGIKQRNKSISEVDDYGMFLGAGVEENSKIDKLESNYAGGSRKDHGVATLFCAAVADS